MKIGQIEIKPVELKGVLLSFGFFFCLMTSFYILRPIRDEMGIVGGTKNLPWLFTVTFVTMLALIPLLSWLMSRYTRKQFLPVVYLFVVVSLFLFFLAYNIDAKNVYLARLFFIWVSVYILFAVSVFWSFMLDLYEEEQSRRLFGFIAAGGSAGGLVGPTLTINLVKVFGISNLMLVSLGFLVLVIVFIHLLVRWHDALESGARKSLARADDVAKSLGKNVFAAFPIILKSPYLLLICLFLFCLTLASTFLYLQQAIVVERFSSVGETRVSFFSKLDLVVNSITILIQIFLTGHLVKWVRISGALLFIPLVLGLGFLAIGIAPVPLVVAIVQIVRRAGGYAIIRPVREMLFSVLDQEARYKAKNFMDTVIYRGGDAVSGWIFAALKFFGLGVAGIALLAVPFAALWGLLGVWLGRKQKAIADQQARELQR